MKHLKYLKNVFFKIFIAAKNDHVKIKLLRPFFIFASFIYVRSCAS